MNEATDTAVNLDWANHFVLFVDGENTSALSALSRIGDEFARYEGKVFFAGTPDEMRDRIEEAGRIPGLKLFIANAAPGAAESFYAVVQHVLRLGRSTGVRLALPSQDHDEWVEGSSAFFAEWVSRIDADTV